jgi:REP element-mobilizing transposase RayT
MRPIAYHITWGTYGTRLRYGPRPTVSRDQNEHGTPVLRYDEHLWVRERENLKYNPVILTLEQMRFIEAAFPDICLRGNWQYHTSAAGPDHVHTVVSSEHDPETIRRLMKRWIGQLLSQRWPRRESESPTWWAECGSIKWIGDEDYLATATGYVSRQRATREVTSV